MIDPAVAYPERADAAGIPETIAIRVGSLINSAQVRKFALDYAGQHKFRFPGGQKTPRYTRVSKDFLQSVEAKLRAAIVAAIDSSPSRGQTL